MRCLKSFCLALLLPIFLFMASGSAYAEQRPVPKLSQRVTDLTQTLTPEQLASLTQKLAELEKSKGSQIAVLMVPSTGEEAIEQFSIRVVDEWKLGRKDIADGVLFLIAKDDKKMRIEVGRGLEGALPDVTASRIIREFVRPQFKKGDFAAGISAGVDKISAVIDGEALPPPKRKSGGSDSYGIDSSLFGLHPLIWLALLIVGLILTKVMNPWLGRGGIGAGGAVAAFLAGTPIGIALLVGVGMVALVSLIGSRLFWDIAGVVMHSGMVGGFGGGSGGSNDSFSGGGGDFGGGGASGDW